MIWMSRIVLIFLITVSAVADLRGAQVQPKLFFSISCIFLGKFGKIVWWPPPPRFEPPPSRNSRSAPGVYVRLTRRRGVCLLSWGLHGDPPQKADPLPPSRTDAPPNTAPPPVNRKIPLKTLSSAILRLRSVKMSTCIALVSRMALFEDTYMKTTIIP